MALLAVNDLNVRFHTPAGVIHAVNGLSFTIDKGDTIAIVGESGSGKTVTSLSILRLLASPPASISGQVLFEGVDLLQLSKREVRRIRGGDISMIFQEPMTSLNPVLTVGRQIVETLKLHHRLGNEAARERAVGLLNMVGIPSPERRIDDYPHQFSGGMRQRAMIAMALACSPKLLIADEPTTALDVTIQAQVLRLMRQLRKEFQSSIMLITHDLGVVAEMADKVVVMYAGRAVETAGVRDLFGNPQHPYTRGLLNSMPKLGSSLQGQGRKTLEEIPGQVPSLHKSITGCAFAPRCQHASAICRDTAPELRPLAPGHVAACHHPTGNRAVEVVR